MHTSTLLTTLSLLSALAPASAQGHWGKRHAHPVKVVVTDYKTVVVDGSQPTSSNPVPVKEAAVNNNNYTPPAPAPSAKSTSSSKAAGGNPPSSTAGGYTPSSTQKAPSSPSATGGTGGINAPGVGGTVTFHNNCDQDVWLWVYNGPHETLTSKKVSKGDTYKEAKQSPGCTGCGICFKVSETSSLVPGKILQFEYSINTQSTQQFNDISFVDCASQDKNVPELQRAKNCPGWSKGLAIKSPSQCIRQIYCAPGSYCTSDAYFVDTPVQKLGLPEPNYTCGQNSNSLDTDFVMCAGDQKSKRSIAGRLTM